MAFGAYFEKDISTGILNQTNTTDFDEDALSVQITNILNLFRIFIIFTSCIFGALLLELSKTSSPSSEPMDYSLVRCLSRLRWTMFGCSDNFGDPDIRGRTESLLVSKDHEEGLPAYESISL